MIQQWICDDDILCGVNQPKDWSNMSELEKKHIPIITAPGSVTKNEPFDVTIEVGKLLPHPNEPVHFIEWVELYCGDTFLGRSTFNGGASYPVACFKVQLSHAHGPLKAWEKCNIHGLWESTKEISVKDM